MDDFWWRLAHLVTLAAVAARVPAERACFLTVWQTDFDSGTRPEPLYVLFL